jgi:hypothetical protein
MAMNPKSNDLEATPEHLSEQQIRKAAKAALKKANQILAAGRKSAQREL